MSQKPKNYESKSSNEFFYLVDGKKQDAALHEDILADGDAKSQENVISQAAANADIVTSNGRFSDNPIVKVTSISDEVKPLAAVIVTEPENEINPSTENP